MTRSECLELAVRMLTKEQMLHLDRFGRFASPWCSLCKGAVKIVRHHFSEATRLSRKQREMG
jgi:hypothetical protein